jgi:hypothetical protein
MDRAGENLFGYTAITGPDEFGDLVNWDTSILQIGSVAAPNVEGRFFSTHSGGLCRSDFCLDQLLGVAEFSRSGKKAGSTTILQP